MPGWAGKVRLQPSPSRARGKPSASSIRHKHSGIDNRNGQEHPTCGPKNPEDLKKTVHPDANVVKAAHKLLMELKADGTPKLTKAPRKQKFTQRRKLSRMRLYSRYTYMT